MNPAPAKCYITGLPATDIPSTIDVIDYFVDYKDKRFTFSFPYSLAESSIYKNNRQLLTALFYNGDWPLVDWQYIDDKIINHIIKEGDYPKTFNEKLEYLLLYLYRNGGKEYQSVPIKLKRNAECIAYTYSNEELWNVIKGLKSKDYIEYKFEAGSETEFIDPLGFAHIKIDLKEAGIHLAEKLDEKDTKKKVIEFNEYGNPKIFIYSPYRQVQYSNALKEIFKESNFEIFDHPEIKNFYNNNNNIVPAQLADEIYDRLNSHNIDFALFIESYFSKNDQLSFQLNEYKLSSKETYPSDVYSRIYFASGTTEDLTKVVDERFANFKIHDVILENKRIDLVNEIANHWVNTKKELDREPFKEQSSENSESKIAEKPQSILPEEINETGKESENQPDNKVGEKPKPEESFLYKSNKPPIISDQVEGVIGVKEIASVLAEIISNFRSDELARMIGIFGRWGRGKTFLYNHLIEYLQEGDPFYHVKFHAWKYQDTPAVWAYLYEVIAEKYFIKPKSFSIREIGNWLGYLWKIIRLNYKRYWLWPYINLIILLIGQIFIWFILKELTIDDFAKYTGLSLSFVISIVGFFKLYQRDLSSKAKELLKKYTSRTSLKQYLGIQAEIQKELKILLETWFSKKSETEAKKTEKLLLFVDDIDRCTDDKILLLIDALRVMVEDPEISERITIITAIDERVLLRAVNIKYHDLLKADLSKSDAERKQSLCIISKEYLDKLFLTGIKLGELSQNERGEIFDAYTLNKKVVNPKKEEEIALANENDKSSQKEESKTIFDPSSDSEIGDVVKTIEESLPKVMDAAVEYASRVMSTAIEKGNNIELENKEYLVLRGLLENFEQATPRLIRIYYYRYLLAKSLFNFKLTNPDLNSSWTTFNSKEFLPKLLLIYSQDNFISRINEDREKLKDEINEEVNFEIYNDKYLINKKLLIALLEVVEMVVPY